jgi:NitT/TauT family transport system substrate-binding protein
MRNILTAIALAMMTAAETGVADAAEQIKIGLIADPGYEAAGWALANGKVKDASVQVSVEFLPIPAMMQAAMTGEFNIMPNGVLAVPQLNASGIDARIIGTILRYNPAGHPCDVWVGKDSKIAGIPDLKGKKIAVTSIESQCTISMRAILSEKYGINAEPVSGVITWVEIPPAQFEAALAAGRVDAIGAGNVQAVGLEKKGIYRSVLSGAKELNELYGGPMVSVLMTAMKVDLEKRPDAYLAAAKLLKASAEYAKTNPGEVFGAVAPKYKISQEDLAIYFSTYTSIPFALGPTDKQVIVKAWESGRKLNAIAAVPPSVDALVWNRAVAE